MVAAAPITELTLVQLIGTAGDQAVDTLLDKLLGRQLAAPMPRETRTPRERAVGEGAFLETD